ncbi:MAG TPA: DUF6152 family protein [Caulobacteraceae bacterium]|nr:DUF6152 family protein [Caulobacteraceae bacterium]
MKVFGRIAAPAALALAAMTAQPASAHHSFAMFDNTKTVTLVGTVKEFEWNNPHSWIQLVVHDAASGKDLEYSIEGQSPNALEHQGWSRHALQVGDTATINIHPLKDGTLGGSLIDATVKGQTFGKSSG